MIGSVIGMLFGLFVLGVVVAELFTTVRRRMRSVRAPGVYVATRDVNGGFGGHNAHSRAAAFRFVTRDGRDMVVESRVTAFPGPRPGKRVTVLYDPDRPHKAETTGRSVAILVFFLPLGLALGLMCVVLNLLDMRAS